MRPVIYQLVVRYFSNTRTTGVADGGLSENGCGRFNDITTAALISLRELGITHIWLTGIQRQATTTDHSAHGLPADPATVVKGRAGSFYAVRDVFDVCPDYAVDIKHRLDEFRALVQRCHAAGLRVLMDLVPNHVSRAHATPDPERNFGYGDDRSQFFSPANHFFYLVDPPGQSLRLPGGTFASEDLPRATGNNVTNPAPSANDWYETVKLNYGWDFVAKRGHYEPRPRTWDLINDVLAHWQSLGIDGFRCDFAHYVPAEAWTWLINRARHRDPNALFIAEAYPYVGSGDPIEHREQLLAAGFNAVYHHAPYEALKRIYQGHSHHRDWQQLVQHDHAISNRLLAYLENHDECRIASPIHRDGWCGDSGFGSAAANYQLAPLHLLSGRGPALIFNGQEVGEVGGTNGRTTIFDYAAMPAMQGWVNHHAYDGGGLSPEQRRLRHFYQRLLALLRDKVGQGSYAPLVDPHSSWIIGYCRWHSDMTHALVVLANFHPTHAQSTTLRIPHTISAALGAPQQIRLHLVLDHTDAPSRELGTMTVEALHEIGWPVDLPNQTSVVIRIEAVS